KDRTLLEQGPINQRALQEVELVEKVINKSGRRREMEETFKPTIEDEREPLRKQPEWLPTSSSVLNRLEAEHCP
ncbi:MAG: hypothetical protein CL914_13725, partial [Deltaproteobacteria bacterium]|nr:hypothetical protein [Deltaproteobacteria bacterium]